MKYRLIAAAEGDRVPGCQDGSSNSLEAIAYQALKSWRLLQGGPRLECSVVVQWVGSDGHPAELYFDGELFLPSGQHREEGWISVELMRHVHGWINPGVAA